MPKETSIIEEGTAFAVPLREGEKFAVGLVARAAPRGRILLGYFFGPARDRVPDLQELAGAGPSAAAYVARFGDLGLVDGSWPVIGRLPDWDRERWPNPQFCRSVDDGRLALAVAYADDDIGELIDETRVSDADCRELPEDGMAGSGFVELRLTRLLREDT